MSLKKQVRSAATSIFCAGLLIGISVVQHNAELVLGGLAIGGLFAVVGTIRMVKALRGLDAAAPVVRQVPAEA